MTNTTAMNEETTPAEEMPQAITFEQLLSLLVSATQGNQKAKAMVRRITMEFQSLGAPPEYQAMGKSIERILNGERSADVLDGLPPQLADAFSQLFGIVISAAPVGGVVKPGSYQQNNNQARKAKPQPKKKVTKTLPCPKCGYENSADALRCRNCGNRFF